MNDPGARNVDFEELRAAYYEQVEALVEGGADLLLVETIFDTLNAKAALFAIDEYFEASGERLPLIISGTVTDASGRILSGQTVTAFWHSVRHAQPLAVGLNCALGAALMRPYIQELAKVAPRHLHQLLPERRPAQPDERDRLRRDARRHLAPAARVRRRGAGQHRGRLLRHHARAHRGDRPGRGAAAGARRGAISSTRKPPSFRHPCESGSSSNSRARSSTPAFAGVTGVLLHLSRVEVQLHPRAARVRAEQLPRARLHLLAQRVLDAGGVQALLGLAQAARGEGHVVDHAGARHRPAGDHVQHGRPSA